jgi:KDO2-lipid IV(A) lauroyltransferase
MKIIYTASNFLIFRISIFFLKLLALFPYQFLYACSNIIAFFLQHVFKYRQKVIFKNLSQSFPEKNNIQILNICTKYYLHLSDLIVEFLIGISANEKYFEKHYTFKNPEIFKSIINNNKPTIILLGHTGNWEWGIFRANYFHKKNYVVYKKINNSYFDNWIKNIRQRTGSILIEMNEITSILSQKNQESFTLALVADQSPVNIANSIWVNFLHQETGFLRGPDVLAKKLNANVVYSKISKPKRGFYEVEFLPLQTNDNICIQFAKTLEKHIQESPEIWLWSHKRWKRTRPENKKLIL